MPLRHPRRDACRQVNILVWDPKHRSEQEIKMIFTEVPFKAMSLDERAYFTEYKYQVFKSQTIRKIALLSQKSLFPRSQFQPPFGSFLPRSWFLVASVLPY